MTAAAGVMVQCSVLISPECFQIDGGGVACHGGELLPGDEPAALPQRDQLGDPVAVPGDGNGLPVFEASMISRDCRALSIRWHDMQP